MKKDYLGFTYFQILEEKDICDLQKPRKDILDGIKSGRKLVIYGRRNTGKTSLIRSVIIPEFSKLHKKSFVYFVDFIEVKNEKQLTERMLIGFEEAFQKAFPTHDKLKKVLSFIKSFRPNITTDPITGSISVSLGFQNVGKDTKIKTLFTELTRIAREYQTLIVFDEFQDIIQVEEAQAFIRQGLESLPKGTPVILLGSKKHMLSKIFSSPNAPLAGWGEDIDFPMIPYEDYHDYMTERFSKNGLSLNLEESIYIQDLMERIPEPINILCNNLMLALPQNTKITSDHIRQTLDNLIEKSSSRLEEYLGSFSLAEQKVLSGIANTQEEFKAQSKEFTTKVGLTAAGIAKIIKKLENHAVIYKINNRYILSDPILSHYLRR